MKPADITYNYIQNYLIQVRATGRYTVTLDELKQRFDVTDKALQQGIFRLKSKDQIAQVRQGFYAIIPPEYAHSGMLPPSLMIDDMMTYLNRDYYVALNTAAALFGAAHQQPMEFRVMIHKPALRNIETDKLRIQFFTKHEWQKNQTTLVKTDAGYMQVSVPGMTAFDLVQYHPKIGGISHCLEILAELAERMRPSELRRIARTQKRPAIQRLGFLLTLLGADRLTSVLHKFVETEHPKVIPLSLAHKNRNGVLDKNWHIIINTPIDHL